MANHRLTKEAFFRRAYELYEDDYAIWLPYDFRSTSRIIVYCKQHDIFWHPIAHTFLKVRDSSMARPGRGQGGCRLCGYERMRNAKRMHKNTFVEKAIKVHGPIYDYTESVFTGNKSPIWIRCPRHGLFKQHTAGMHLIGHGCPVCKFSKLEREVNKYLLKTGCKYKYQHRVEYISSEDNKKHLSIFDFVVFNTDGSVRCAIECNGRQHYEPVSIFGGVTGLGKQQKRDSRKYKYCIDNNVQLIVISAEQDLTEVFEEAGALLY